MTCHQYSYTDIRVSTIAKEILSRQSIMQVFVAVILLVRPNGWALRFAQSMRRQRPAEIPTSADFFFSCKGHSTSSCRAVASQLATQGMSHCCVYSQLMIILVVDHKIEISFPIFFWVHTDRALTRSVRPRCKVYQIWTCD